MVQVPRAQSVSSMQHRAILDTSSLAPRRRTIFSLFDSAMADIDEMGAGVQYDDFGKTVGEEMDVPSLEDMQALMAQNEPATSEASAARSATSQPSGTVDTRQNEVQGRRIRANVRETGFDSMKYYMKTMGNHDLLQKNEEIILAREIQILIKWEEIREGLETELLR